MRNELRLDRISISPKSLLFWCACLLLTSRISAQTENETFENAFGLHETPFAESKESINNENHENPVPPEDMVHSLSEVADLNQGEGNHLSHVKDEEEKVDAGANHIDDTFEGKNEGKDEVVFSGDFSGKIAGEKNGKYVRYGE